MQLVINTYGAYLRKKDNCFLIKNDEKTFEVSVKKVDSIMITTGSYLSTDAIEFAMDNNIDILFLNKFGDPFGRVWHSKLGSTTLIRRNQLTMTTNSKGFMLATGWIAKKIDNQIWFLEDLKNARPKVREKLVEYIESLKEIKEKLVAIDGTLDEKRGSIMGLEGIAGRTYFSALSFILPERFQFKGRSRNPAKDEFNCLLNYSYGVLYGLVEKACLIAGLDPYIGFIHTDNYNKKSLVFDLIEMYRVLAERTVINLFSKRQVKTSYFDKIRGGMTLNKEGKAVLIQDLNDLLEKKVRYKGRNIKNRNIIQLDCHSIANNLIK